MVQVRRLKLSQQGFTIQVAALDQRTAHRKALFSAEMPYARKVEKSRKAYSRNPKHRNKGDF